ncbi:MAG TPA: DUF6212 domain-containing protein [Rhizomicrobium sp.]|nr:DUF6212 domain-containing protein [Rhizomicrobium sp.]
MSQPLINKRSSPQKVAQERDKTFRREQSITPFGRENSFNEARLKAHPMMGPFIAVAQSDQDKSTLGNVLPVATLMEGATDPHLLYNGERLPEHVLWTDLLGGVAFSAEALQSFASLTEVCSSRFGYDEIAVLDLSNVSGDNHEYLVQSWLVQRLLMGRQMQARRNTELMRGLAELREHHEHTQTAFSRLERFVVETGAAVRKPILSLQPASDISAAILKDGDLLEQRLPCDSSGLSDFALYVQQLEPGDGGQLTVNLSTCENEEIVAGWSIASQHLVNGWLRLSLPASLGVDQLTPALHLSWEGLNGVSIAHSVKHPDLRHQARRNGRETGSVLALKVWKYIAGCTGPVTSDGVLPNGSTVTRRIVSPEALAEAMNLNPGNDGFLFNRDFRALQVHPFRGGVAAGLLPNSAPKGSRRISAKVITRTDKAPDVEYALALARTGDRSTSGQLPEFPDGMKTDWRRLPPLTQGELHLFLSEPLELPHDLYLMTRLPDDVPRADWAWANFEQVEICLA